MVKSAMESIYTEDTQSGWYCQRSGIIHKKKTCL